ncbi:MAG: flippase-like domain-containing protein [Bacteroidales bacterium]|nr:flippase-like domain-containing protein [Bacteroidales bacterium]
MKAKVRKSLNFLLQIGIILVAYGFIYRQVVQKMEITELVTGLTAKFHDSTFLIYLGSVFLLMFVNLGVEAWKWKFLISKFETVSFMNSFKAVFSGITVSVFTPNRVGEYFGRVFILKSLHPVKGILITFIGSMGQLMATILIGSFGVLLFLPRIMDAFIFPNHLIFIGIVITTLIILTLLVVLYLHFSILSQFARKLFPAKTEKINKYAGVFESYSSADLSYVLLLSILRYCVFTTQFILLLLAFEMKLPFMHYLIVIPVIFLVMTLIPSVALSELGIRGSVSLYLISLFLNESAGIYDPSSLGIVVASTLLWLINLAIPAITGAVFVFNLRFIRSKNNQSGS